MWRLGVTLQLEEEELRWTSFVVSEGPLSSGQLMFGRTEERRQTRRRRVRYRG